MKSASTARIALALSAGIASAMLVISIGKASVTTNVTPKVSVSETRIESGETIPVVTVTAKKLTPTEKVALAASDAHARHNGQLECAA